MPKQDIKKNRGGEVATSSPPETQNQKEGVKNPVDFLQPKTAENSNTTTQNLPLPKDWVETTLGEVSKFVNDKIGTEKINLENYISTENLLPNRLGIQKATTLPNILKVNNFLKEDILFSNIRTYFKKVWFASFDGGSSNDVLIFRPVDEKVLDKKFLYYLISSDKFINFTVLSAKGTKMPRGDKSAIQTFKINLPPLPQQKAIASILSSFDDKIELLREENETLEKIGQEIFKEWFGKYSVDKPEELPKGWRVGKLRDIAIPQKGKNITKKQVVNGKFPVIAGGINPSVFHNESNTKSPVITISASGANAGFVNLHHNPVWSSDSLFIDNTITDYLYFCFVFLKINQSLVYDKQEGSAIPHVYSRHLENLKLIIPLKDKLNEFEEMVKINFNKMKNNSEQIQRLSKTRDTLLPKLMKGEIEVN